MREPSAEEASQGPALGAAAERDRGGSLGDPD